MKASEAPVEKELGLAWTTRERAGLLRDGAPLRVFHGPGEGSGGLRLVSVDRFRAHEASDLLRDHFWITEWEARGARGEKVEGTAASISAMSETLIGVTRFLVKQGARSVVALRRPERGVPADPVTLHGEPPADGIVVREGGDLFRIRLQGVKHPGLFLDHAPLRDWLRRNARGWRALNTFAYTGSLSVACARGGAREVVTLDLSGATTEWARENWRLNGWVPDNAAPGATPGIAPGIAPDGAKGESLSLPASRFIAGDVFEWLPRLKRQGARFDAVILDPPSFSRGKKGDFSTQKDLRKLHELAFALLEPGGYAVTSINSENVPRDRFEAEVRAASESVGIRFELVERIELPDTFPTRSRKLAEGYLKGLILKAR